MIMPRIGIVCGSFLMSSDAESFFFAGSKGRGDLVSIDLGDLAPWIGAPERVFLSVRGLRPAHKLNALAHTLYGHLLVSNLEHDNVCGPQSLGLTSPLSTTSKHVDFFTWVSSLGMSCAMADEAFENEASTGLCFSSCLRVK